MSITGKITGDDRVIERFSRINGRANDELVNTVGRLVISLQRKVVQEKLSGQVLKRRTGTLARSIQFMVTSTPTGVVGVVGSRIKEGSRLSYAAIHEYGGTIPAHIVTAIRANVLHFTLKNGKEMFRKSVTIPEIKMPERSYLRSSLGEMKSEIQAELKSAVLRGSTK